MSSDISITNVRHRPDDPQEGETVEFNVEVENTGYSTIESIDVVIYDESDSPVYVPVNFDLPPGESQWGGWTGYSDFDVGTHELSVVVEEDEANEAEETYTLTVGGNLGWITGDVTTESGGEATNARVQISGPGDTTTKMVSDGEFRFDDLPAGTYDVEVYGSSIEGFETEAVVNSGEGTHVEGQIEQETHELTIETTPISVDIDGDEEGEYPANEEVRIVAPEEHDGYEFEEWQAPDGDKVWDDPEFEFSMYGDYTRVAKYVDPGNPNLQVNSIDTHTDDPTEEDTVSFDIEIENVGEVEANGVDLEVSPDNGGTFTEYNIDIEAGQRRTIEDIGDWDPDPGWQWIEAEINPDRTVVEEDYQENEDRDTVEITEVDPPEPDPVINLYVEDIAFDPQTPKPDDEILITGYVGNSGNTDAENAEIDVDIDGESTITKTVYVSASDRKQITLATVTKEAGTHSVDVEINPDRDIEEDDYTNNTASNDLFVEEEKETIDAAITISDEPSGTYTRGDIVSVTTTVQNTGNTPHTYFVGLSVSDESGDEYTNAKTTGTTATLDTNERKEKTLTWSVPQDAVAGEYDIKTVVWKESDRNNLNTQLDSVGGVSAFSVEEKTDIDGQVSSVTVSNTTPNVDEEITITPTIQNTGNTETTFEIGVEITDQTGSTIQESTQQTETISPDTSVTPTFNWTTPTPETETQYDIKTTVWKTESQSEQLSTTTESALLTVTPPEQKDAKINIKDHPSGTVSRGNTAITTVEVTNTGNIESTHYIGYTVNGPNGTAYTNSGETGTQLTLTAGETQQTDLAWDIPSDAPSGKYDIATVVWKQADKNNLTDKLDEETATNVFSIDEKQTPIDESLSITNISFSETQITEPTTLTITTTVENTAETDYSATVETLISSDETSDSHQATDDITVSKSGTTTITTETEITEEWENGEYDTQSTISTPDGNIDNQTADTTVVISFENGPQKASLTLKAVDPSFNTVDDAVVELQGDNVSHQEEISVTGETTIEDLPQGTYDYKASSPSMGQLFEGSLALAEAAEERLVKFKHAKPISGVVVGGDGKPVPSATVSVDVRGNTYSAETNDLGRFNIRDDIPSGETTFTVEKNGTAEIDKSTLFKNTVQLKISDNGTFAKEEQPDEVPEEVLEELSINNTDPILALFVKNPLFRAKVLAITTNARILYGGLHGLFTQIKETAVGLVNTVKAIIGAILNIDDIIMEIVDAIYFALTHPEEVYGYINNVLDSLSIPDFDKPQREDNPYNEDGDQWEKFKYNQFKSGWYVGYIVGIILTGAGAGKVISRANVFFKSMAQFNKGLNRLQSAVNKAEDAVPASNRISSTRPDTGDTGSIIGSAQTVQAISDAPDKTVTALADLLNGAYSVNHITIKMQAQRARFLEKVRDLDEETLKTQKMNTLKGELNKDPDSIKDGAIANIKGGGGEYIGVSYMIRTLSGQFSDITKNDIYGSLFSAGMSQSSKAIITGIDLSDFKLSDYVKDGYSVNKLKDDFDFDPNDLDGELDHTVVETPKVTNGKSVVTRVIEQKSGSRARKGDVKKKLEHIGKLQQLADHPKIDSNKVVNAWGIPLKAFTRARDRDDIDTPGSGDGLDLQYMMAKDTTDEGVTDGDHNPDFGKDIPVSNDIIRLDHTADEIKEATSFIVRGKDGERTPNKDGISPAEKRRDHLKPFFDPEVN